MKVRETTAHFPFVKKKLATTGAVLGQVANPVLNQVIVRKCLLKKDFKPVCGLQAGIFATYKAVEQRSKFGRRCVRHRCELLR